MSIRSLLRRRATRASLAMRTVACTAGPIQAASLPPEALEPRLLLAFFSVTTTADAGPGSLRQAMLDANATPEPDAIQFLVPQGSVIQPQSPLPTVTGAMVFRSGPGTAGASAPTIELDGSAAGPTADGLVFASTASGSRIEGLAIDRFGGSGIVTSAPATTSGITGLILKNTYIGTDLAGPDPNHTYFRGNGRFVPGSAGLKALAGADVLVGWPGDFGGADPAGGAVIAQNLGDGVQAVDATLAFFGASILENSGRGITVSGERATINVTGPDNLFRLRPASSVSGNLDGGILLGPGSHGSSITGATIRDNAGDGSGIEIHDSHDNTIQLNDISVNSAGGLWLRGTVAHDNTAFGNVISGNGGFGVGLAGGAHNNFFGGLRTNPRDPSLANRIVSNGSPGDSRSRASGVLINGAGTDANVFMNNHIDDNTESGVEIFDGASGNLFLTVTNLDTASISGNAHDGVVIRDTARYNAFYGVSIDRNGMMAIDLRPTGPNPNDPLDADVGPNSLLNHPVVTSAVQGPDGRTTITGSIDTAANTAVTIQLFRDRLPASGTFGEGGPQARVAVVNVTTDAAGHADFSATVEPSPGGEFDPPNIAPGDFITALATVAQPGAQPLSGAVAGDTSELSPAARVGTAPQVAQVYVNGSSWAQRFRDYLARSNSGSAKYGSALGPDYFADDATKIAWVNVDEISIRFTEDVRIKREDVNVQGERLNGYGVDLHYDPQTFTATLKLPRTIPADRVAVQLNAWSEGVVARDDGAALDGDADGQPGGTFSRRFVVGPGDVVQNGRVDAIDLSAVRQSLNADVDAVRRPSGTVYDPRRDIDGSGRIDALDLALIRRLILTPWPPPAPGPGITDSASAATGILKDG
jgi:parallel beta-helix repeat protein